MKENLLVAHKEYDRYPPLHVKLTLRNPSPIDDRRVNFSSIELEEKRRIPPLEKSRHR